MAIRFREKKAKREAITLRLGSWGLLPTGPIRASLMLCSSCMFFTDILVGKIGKNKGRSKRREWKRQKENWRRGEVKVGRKNCREK